MTGCVCSCVSHLCRASSVPPSRVLARISTPHSVLRLFHRTDDTPSGLAQSSQRPVSSVSTRQGGRRRGSGGRRAGVVIDWAMLQRARIILLARVP